MAIAPGHRLRYLTSKHPFGSTKLPSWTSVKPRVKPSEPLAGGVARWRWARWRTVATLLSADTFSTSYEG